MSALGQHKSPKHKNKSADTPTLTGFAEKDPLRPVLSNLAPTKLS